MVGVLWEAMAAPVSSLLIAFNTALYMYQWSQKIAPESLAVSLKQVVGEGEYWRLVTAGVTHGSAMHLLFNMASLWNMRDIEALRLGSRTYLRDSIAILFLSKALMLGIHYLASRKFGLSRFDSMMSVGYSGVIFAWMTVKAMWNPSGQINIIGNLNIPVVFAPFGSLIFTQLIVPRASFTGHLAGIFAGFMASFGAFEWLNWYWMSGFVVAITGVTLVSAAATTSLTIPLIQVDREQWNRTSLRDLVSTPAPPQRRQQTDWGSGTVGRALNDRSSRPQVSAPTEDEETGNFAPYRDYPDEQERQ